ncbi:class II glutamine amidotransferase [Nocardioides jishulii]|uniref:Class II glutamine amidotransferase n=1 Tax=Nocardioides jishulii TaxID=2575440 RepID=A0A4U2YMW8_9ACTN|nr:class II glutamine amidotransferase [Nocardioides jishulii]QCX27802.1 class II glutamine amidotransferase [Nocardioides jishulii]TKI62609.1 class II glutamine amidotransferase [Nocardioides jishulii]
MCRWLAYTGSPVLVHDLLYRPEHSLIVQSLSSTMGAETTNGDGFGLGWYTDLPTPGVIRSTEPAWNDRNLEEISAHIRSPCVLAHVRASSGSAVQQTNCHPFRHGRWLFMHNGSIDGFLTLKYDLAMAVDPVLFAGIEGSSDTEMFFHLALTLGLEEDPVGAVSRAVGLIEETGRRHGVDFPLQMTVGMTDGETFYAFRYSSQGRSRTLFHSADIATLQQQYPGNQMLRRLSEDAKVVVSEPLSDLKGAWREIPESTCLVLHKGQEQMLPFEPQPRLVES